MTTKVIIEPGICKQTCVATVSKLEGYELELDVSTGCPSIKGLFEELGTTFDAFEVCLQKPGCGPFYDYASEHFPAHVSCPTLCGIVKAMEVEAKLALPADATIRFER